MPDPSLNLPVFDADATMPAPDSAAPSSPAAVTGPVAAPEQYTTQSAEDSAAALQSNAADVAASGPQAVEAPPDGTGPWSGFAQTGAAIAQTDTMQSVAQSDVAKAEQLWLQSDSSAEAIQRLLDNFGYPADLNYKLPAQDSQEWSSLTAGIPAQYWDRLGNAVSADHAQHIADEVRTELSQSQQWQQHSAWTRVGMGLLDPAGLALALVPGFGDFAEGSRIARMLKGGVQAATLNAGLQAFLDTGKQTVGPHDVASATLQGFVLGGVLHGIVPAAEADQAGRDALSMHHELALNELQDGLDQGHIPEDAVRPEVLAELKQRQAEQAAVTTEGAPTSTAGATEGATEGSPPAAEGIFSTAPVGPSVDQGVTPQVDLDDQVDGGGLPAADAEGSEPVGMNSGFGPDSASAARAADIVAPAVERSAGGTIVPQSSRGAKALIGPFKTFSSVLRGSGNAIVRSRLGRMFGEAIAARDASSATVGASDHMSVLRHSWETRAGQIVQAHKYDWMREQGYSAFWNKYNLKVEHEWSTSVGRAIRGIDTDSKPVKEAARKYGELYREMLREAKRAGVKGFDGIEENEHYLPRSFDFDAIHRMNWTLGDNGMAQFLADSIQKATPDIDRTTAERIGAGYLARTKKLSLGVDLPMMHGIRLDDFEYLRELLGENESITPQDIDSTIEELRRVVNKESPGTGAVKYAKPRVQFDETHSMMVKDAGGNMTPVSIADLWSNDVTRLTERYTRIMSGVTGLARVGIKSDADFRQSLAEALSSMQESGAGREDMGTVRAYAEGGYKLLTGKPVDNEHLGLFAQASAVARNYAYTRSMNQAGFSIANNLIRPWTNGYARYTSKYLPAMAGIFRRGADGELTDELAREIERFTGMASDSVNQQIWSHFEADSLMARGIQRTGHWTKVAGRITSHISGMTPGLIFGQRLMALGIVDRLIRYAHGEADIPVKRLAIMGLDDPMVARIKDQLLKFAPETAEGGRIRSVNWSQWKDLDARDAMLTAVHREARILIHGEDMASTGLWMNKWWGRLAIQLRRFPMMAMSKQLLRGLHMRDLDTLNDFLITSTLGSASFAAQTKLRSIGMDDQDKQAYLDKNLNLGRIIAAGLQRNPYSGMLPQLIDTVADSTVGQPIFDARGSGLSTNLLSPAGMPVSDALSKMSTVLSYPLQNAARSDRQWTRSEWKALTSVMPLGNSFPMVWLTNAMADHFPKAEPKGGEKGSLLDEAVNGQ